MIVRIFNSYYGAGLSKDFLCLDGEKLLSSRHCCMVMSLGYFSLSSGLARTWLSVIAGLVANSDLPKCVIARFFMNSVSGMSSESLRNVVFRINHGACSIVLSILFSILWRSRRLVGETVAQAGAA